MRRTEGRDAAEDEEPLIVGDLKVNPSTHEVFIGGREVSLTPAEFQLTQLLVKNHGAVVSRGQIEKELAKVVPSTPFCPVNPPAPAIPSLPSAPSSLAPPE